MKAKDSGRPPRPPIDTPAYMLMVARLIRNAGKRVSDANVEDLQSLIELRDDLDAAILRAVIGLRVSGATWQEIGNATGTTRQAAIQKWAHKVG